MTYEQIMKVLRANITSGQEWVLDNLQYLTLMGSHAYGLNHANSDWDVYGFTIPPENYLYPSYYEYISGFDTFPVFEQFQFSKKTGSKNTHIDVVIYNITKYFRLVMENNPNMIDSLFTSPNCILYCTNIGKYVRDNRKEFLSKNVKYKFLGYAASQLKKIRTNPDDKRNPDRKENIKKYGYDCYTEETEFLTNYGWAKFGDITDNFKLATLNIKTNKVEYQNYTEKYTSKFTGNLYNFGGVGTSFTVTPNHRIFNRPVLTSKRNKLGEFKFAQASNMSHTFDIIQTITPKKTAYTFTDVFKDISLPPNVFMVLLGLYIAEGTIRFRKNKKDKKVKAVAISQLVSSPVFKYTFKHLHANWSEILNSHIYEYKRVIGTRNLTEGLLVFTETKLINKIYNEVGHMDKRIPRWVFSLSQRLMLSCLKAMIQGDGTEIQHKTVSPTFVYHTSSKLLADDVQELAFLCGAKTCIWGPYTSDTTYKKNLVMYRVYINFNSPQTHRMSRSQNIKITSVIDKPIVCFTVPNEMLITRLNGNIAIQGNSKFATHLYRLIEECEQILTTGDLDLFKNKEKLKLVATGMYTLEEIQNHFKEREIAIQKIYDESTLPWGTKDIENKVREILVNSLKMTKQQNQIHNTDCS